MRFHAALVICCAGVVASLKNIKRRFSKRIRKQGKAAIESQIKQE